MSGLALGQAYSITIQAQNATGWGPESDPAINVDITPPVLSLTNPPNGAALATTPVFSGTAGTDANDLPTVTVTIYAGADAPPVRPCRRSRPTARAARGR